jgi:hypothetical protein
MTGIRLDSMHASNAKAATTHLDRKADYLPQPETVETGIFEGDKTQKRGRGSAPAA